LAPLAPLERVFFLTPPRAIAAAAIAMAVVPEMVSSG